MSSLASLKGPEPEDADRHYALGRRQRAASEDDAAEASYRAALTLRPQFTDAWISLGILLKAVGRLEEAAECQRTAVRLDPANFLAHLNLGNVLAALGGTSEAAAEFGEAIKANPACAEAHNNLGHLLLAGRNRAEAARHFAAALSIRADYFEAAMGLGEALVDTYKCEAAIQPLTLASRLRPSDLNVQVWLGRAYSGAGQYSRAATEFERVLRVDARYADAICGLATSLAFLGQFSKPRAMLKALAGDANSRAYHRFEYATLLLRAGEYREGWSHYGTRWVRVARELPEPRWQGEDLTGKTLLIVREQGLGDEIMFASVISEILQRVKHCIIECDRRLADLYRRSFPRATVFGVDLSDPHCDKQLDARRNELPVFDCWSAIGDLPRFYRNEAGEFPRHQGYLSADPARIQAWRDRLATSAFKIGIAWRGGVVRTRAGERSIPLEQLRPILSSLPDVQFVSLQHGPHAEELEQFRRGAGLSIEHWQPAIEDIDECAALVCSLDMVISVCSSVVHLSGALGRPTWVMAPLVPEWRYGHQGESMIWYPSARVFRQEKANEWNPVIARVKRALQKAQRERRAERDLT